MYPRLPGLQQFYEEEKQQHLTRNEMEAKCLESHAIAKITICVM